MKVFLVVATLVVLSLFVFSIFVVEDDSEGDDWDL